jgi:hypothetical protein
MPEPIRAILQEAQGTEQGRRSREDGMLGGRACARLTFIAGLGVACGNTPPEATTLSGPPGRMLTYDGGLHPVEGAGGAAATPIGAGGAGGTEPIGWGGGGSGARAGSGGSAGYLAIDGGGTTKRCAGTAWSCSIAPTTNCASVMGCRSGGECTGISTSCYSMYSSYSCGSQEGCYWSSSSSYCSGSSWSCDLFSGDLSCIYQDGCYWHDTCEGVSTPCSLMSAGTCYDQPGCYLQ